MKFEKDNIIIVRTTLLNGHDYCKKAYYRLGDKLIYSGTYPERCSNTNIKTETEEKFKRLLENRYLVMLVNVKKNLVIILDIDDFESRQDAENWLDEFRPVLVAGITANIIDTEKGETYEI